MSMLIGFSRSCTKPPVLYEGTGTGEILPCTALFAVSYPLIVPGKIPLCRPICANRDLYGVRIKKQFFSSLVLTLFLSKEPTVNEPCVPLPCPPIYQYTRRVSRLAPSILAILEVNMSCKNIVKLLCPYNVLTVSFITNV